MKASENTLPPCAFAWNGWWLCRSKRSMDRRSECSLGCLLLSCTRASSSFNLPWAHPFPPAQYVNGSLVLLRRLQLSLSLSLLLSSPLTRIPLLHSWLFDLFHFGPAICFFRLSLASFPLLYLLRDGPIFACSSPAGFPFLPFSIISFVLSILLHAALTWTSLFLSLPLSNCEWKEMGRP